MENEISIFKEAKWIWAKNSLDVDDYAEFKFSFKKSENVILKLSCDSFYAVYLNGNLVKFMGCSDYPHHKFYDEISLNSLQKNNEIIIDVWHQGVGSQMYFPAEHGLIFELLNDNKIVLSSNENIKSRVMNKFKNGYKKSIDMQQGLSFLFENTKEKSDFGKSILVNKDCQYFKRNIKDIKLLNRQEISIIEKEKSIIIDLGKETAGLPDLDIDSPIDQTLLIAYGEHINDGGVRRIISNRDFSFEFIAKAGKNNFLNPLKRIAGRYLEIFYKEKLTINYAGIRPVKYEHKVINKKYNDELIDKINSVCIDTLELCMHEHYEDCPWREQCLYVLDSMNQMMCGYVAFEGFEYARHNIELIAASINSDGFLPICSPTFDDKFIIPFFNLMFVKQVSDYIDASGDYSIHEIVDKPIHDIMENFKNRLTEDHLIPVFERPHFWNFYEWADESDGNQISVENSLKQEQYDLTINTAFCYAVSYYNKMYDKNIDISQTIKAIKETFYDKERNVFNLTTNTKSYSQLGNALACLIGLGNDKLLDQIKNDPNMILATLSVRTFVYDALLLDESNKNYVLDDIKMRYKKMLDEGATSFWETEKGEADFNNAGSLCHGWSCVPVYYFDLLLK